MIRMFHLKEELELLAKRNQGLAVFQKQMRELAGASSGDAIVAMAVYGVMDSVYDELFPMEEKKEKEK